MTAYFMIPDKCEIHKIKLFYVGDLVLKCCTTIMVFQIIKIRIGDGQRAHNKTRSVDFFTSFSIDPTTNTYLPTDIQM